MALEDKEKARILLEESYRNEIRQELEKHRKDKSTGKFSAFVNSSFGLWLLSAIFISGAGTLYQQWQKGRDEQKALFEKMVVAESENNDEISKLDVEISYRLSTVLLRLASAQGLIDAKFDGESNDVKQLQNASFTYDVLQSLNLREHENRISLYPEYSTYTFSTLLAELRRRLPEVEREPVESSIASYASMLTNMKFSGDNPASKQVGELLFKKVILKRWQGTAFHHVDCNEETPFC